MTFSRLRRWLRKTPSARRPAPRPRPWRSALWLERLEDRVTPNAVSWTGQGDGSSWADGRNWSGGAVPGSGDDVTINTFATVNHPGTDSVHSLTLSGGTLANSGSLTTQGLTLSSSFATLNDTGSVTVNGLFNWTSGNITGTGHTVLNGASSLSGGFFSMLTDQTVDNHGTATIGSGSSIDFRGNAVWNNDSDGTFVLQDSGSIGNFFASTTSGFNNFGTFQKSVAGSATIGVAFNNSGTTDVQTGTLTLSSGGTGGGTFTVEAGATLAPGGTYTFNGATETGAGAVQVGTFNTLNVAGPSSVQNLTVNGGTVNVSTPLAVTALTISGGTVNVNAPLTVQTLALSGGTLTGPAAVTVNGAFTWTAGSLNGAGDTVLNGTSTLTGSFFSPLQRQVDNYGTASVVAGTSLTFENNVAFNNEAGATLVLPDSAGMSTFFSAGSALNNAGLLKKTAPAGTATLGVAVNNTGTIDVQAGTLALNGGGANSGNIDIESGTTLSVTGPYTLNGGSITGPGSFQISGSASVTVSAPTSLAALTLSGGSLTANAPLSVQNLTVSGGAVTASTGSITAGNFTLSNGTVTAAAALTAQNLTFSGGTLTGTGTVTVNGTFTWSGGNLNGTGDTVLNGTSSLNGSFFSALARQIDNYGTATVVAGASLSFQNNAVFNNEAGATLALPDSASMTTFFSNGSALNNAGLLEKTAPGGTSTLGLPVNNTGTIDVQAGTLALTGGGVGGGTFTVENGATLSLGNYTFQGTTVTGAGPVQVGTFNTLTVAGPSSVQNLTISGGTVTANAPLTVQNLNLSNGSLTGPATVTVSGLFNWTGGSLNGTGDTVLNGTSTLNGSFFAALARQVDNYGTATVVAGSSLSFQNNAVFNNEAGATLALPDSAGMSTFFSNGSALNNFGLLEKTAPGGTSTLGVAVNNTGTIDVQAGTLALNGGGVGSDTFTVEGGATLSIGNYTLQGATVTGAGAVQVSTFNTLTVSGASSVQNLNINGGTVTANAPLTIQNLTFSSGTLTGPATVTVSGPFNWTGGSLSGTGDTVVQGPSTITGTFFGGLSRQLDNYGTATVVAGSTVYFENNAAWNNEPGAALILPDSAGMTTFFSNGSVINNAGLIQKAAPGSTSSVGLTVNNTGTIEVDAGTLSLAGLTNVVGTTLSGGTYLLSGVLQVPGADIHTNAATVVLNGPAAELFNSAFFSQNDAFTNLSANAAAGSLTLENGKALTTPGDFSNAGAVAVGAGSAFTATGNYTQTAGATAVDGTLTANNTVTVNGGVLSGAGTVNANVVNAALVSPGDSPGILSINGDYTQTPNGAINVEIGGPDPGTGYDQLAVSGSASLAGAFNIVMINNYVPDYGTRFHVLTFTGRSGDFDPYNGQNIGNGRYLYQQFVDDHGLDLLTVHLNHPPVLAHIDNQTVNEGSLLTFTASATDPDDGQTLTYTLDPGAPDGAAIDPVTGVFTYTPPDGPATYQVTVRVTDDGLPPLSDAKTFTINVLPVPPTASLSGPADGVPGQPRTFTLGATEPSVADEAAGLTYQIAWGDGSSQTVAGPNGVQLDHVYTAPGTYAVYLTATDTDGAASAVVSQAITIQSAELQGTTLVVGGTTGDNVIRIVKNSDGTAGVTINGVSQGAFAGATTIIAYGQSGNDTISVSPQLTVPAILFGGGGNDELHGDAGNDVLVGGSGTNILLGGGGRSILIGGGGGTNTLVGQSGDDLLIAGTTAFDSNVTALLAILAEWSSSRDYLTRIANLTGTGSGADFANRLNGGYFLLPGQTVFADAGGSTLVGGPGQDWFLAGVNDLINGRHSDEVWTQL